MIENYEQAFRDGANAMQGRIVAVLMLKGQKALAVEILKLPLPDPRPPERQTVTK